MNNEEFKNDLAQVERQVAEAQTSIMSLQRALAQKQTELIASQAVAAYVRATIRKEENVPVEPEEAG